MKDETFLSRWSRKKTEAKVTPPAEAERPVAEVAPATVGAQLPSEPAPQPLPPVETLTPESDFTPFLQAGVDPGMKRAALKQLFRDPRFNVMDGMDVYIDDYSKPDPLPEGWLEKLEQVKRLGAFQEPDEAAAEGAAAGNEPLQKTMAEQPLAPPAEPAPPDTSNVANPPSEVGKSAEPGN